MTRLTVFLFLALAVGCGPSVSFVRFDESVTAAPLRAGGRSYRVWGAFRARERVWFDAPGDVLSRLLSVELPRRMRDIADPGAGDRLALIDFSMASMPLLGMVRAEGLVLQLMSAVKKPTAPADAISSDAPPPPAPPAASK